MSFLKLPVVGKTIKKVNWKIKKNGVHSVMNELISKTGTRLLIQGKDKNLKKIFKQNSVLVVGNHLAKTDVLVLLAGLEQREDINLAIDSSFIGALPNMDKYLIPMYINARQMASKGSKLGLKWLRKVNNSKDYPKEIEHQKNIENIRLASKKLDQGQLVAIFPSGGERDEKWLTGVGYLVKGVKKKKSVYIVKAFIEGTSLWDYVRLIPGMAKFMPKYKINFSEPMKLDSLESLEPKEIKTVLELDYNQWINRISVSKTKFLTKLLFNQKAYAIFRSIFLWLLTKPN